MNIEKNKTKSENPKDKMKELTGINVTNLSGGKLDVDLIGQKQEITTITLTKANKFDKSNQRDVVKQLVEAGLNLKSLKTLIKLSISNIPIFEAIALNQAINLKNWGICSVVEQFSNIQELKKIAKKAANIIFSNSQKKGHARAKLLKDAGYREEDFVL